MAVDLEFIGSFISLHRKTGFLAAIVVARQGPVMDSSEGIQ